MFRKRRAKRIATEAFREGWLSGIYGGLDHGLGYTTESAQESRIRQMAYSAGYRNAHKLVDEHLADRQSGRWRPRRLPPEDIIIPAEVMVEALGLEAAS